MANTSAYENLYNNMKKSFTVAQDNCEYSLGGYMRMKANEKRENAILPVAVTQSVPGALRTFASYVNEKLTVKREPAPEKTIRSFPLRTSLAACLSAVLVCTLMFSYAILHSGASIGEGGSYVVEATDTAEEENAQLTYNTEK